jgi:hypothetical protein
MRPRRPKVDWSGEPNAMALPITRPPEASSNASPVQMAIRDVSEKLSPVSHSDPQRRHVRKAGAAGPPPLGRLTG